MSDVLQNSYSPLADDRLLSKISCHKKEDGNNVFAILAQLFSDSVSKWVAKKAILIPNYWEITPNCKLLRPKLIIVRLHLHLHVVNSATCPLGNKDNAVVTTKRGEKYSEA